MTHAHDEDENELGWVTQNPQIEALKACPFCGGEAERFENELTGLMTMVRCRQCGAEAFDAEWNRRASQEAAVPSEEPVATFQDRVQPWMMACFGAEISGDKVERGDRLLEEVLELLQSGGYDPARVGALRDYVWGRPAGEPSQEVGGVQVTLAAYCLAFGLDMHAAGETELARIWTKIDKIRAKQAAKPVGSALPVASPAVAPVAVSVKEVEQLREYAKAATIAITGLTAGGSEYFSKQIGNIYTADLDFCVKRIRESREAANQRWKDTVRKPVAEAIQPKAKKSITELVEMHKHLLIALEASGAPFLPEHNYHLWSNVVLDAMTVIGDLSAALSSIIPATKGGGDRAVETMARALHALDCYDSAEDYRREKQPVPDKFADPWLPTGIRQLEILRRRAAVLVAALAQDTDGVAK